ncbi:hypothetical protein OG735_15705 [Streptomyces sp. NBC_01210]|uniref:hypothetical protein n=1 Tax=Streptomyces sp. NBC_01210 TaxID=2903774 RepID=UPI002E1099FB|nr:hypothetical protein OG735_15705 [Streptomyces sp. NBC_01210]
MRLRNALAAGVTAATIAPAVLTGSAAVAAAVTAHAAAATLAEPAEPAEAPEQVAAPQPATVSQSAAAPGTAAAQVPGPGAGKPAADKPAADKPGADKPGADKPGEQQPTCGKVSDPDFPIDTRIHGGPTVHRPGGGFQEWSVDLANTTDESCRSIHPVIIFSGRDRGLTPARITLEFHDDKAALWRPVTLETTAEDEVVGVLDGGFPGFVVPARKSVTVRVRLSLAPDTPPNQVTVNAAVVQRKGNDGDWVGESGDYRFAVVDDDGSGASVTLDELATTGIGSLLRLGAALGAVLLCSGALVLASRRLRARRR